MPYNQILVRYGEMILKGKNRKDFIRRLTNNLKILFSSHPNLYYNCQHDRLFIELNGTNPEILIEGLRNVFGISSFSLAIKTINDIDKIVEVATTMVKSNNGKTFKIIAHRSDKKFPIISDQINRVVAGFILQHTDLKVDVHNPDIKILIEVREDGTYVMDNKYQGAQGFPVGSADRALLLLSGGIDSVTAGYLSMKRGLYIECLHFESAPYTSALALDKVRQLVKKLTLYQNRIRLHIVSFTDIQLAIRDGLPESYGITIMRRMMMRVAESIAKERSCLALVNGESLGQVASQTLSSMQVIGEVTDLPILRPLVTYDKAEIIELAKKIDTYEISCLPYEDCCTIFTPKKPTTQPQLAKAQFYEARLDYQNLINQCLEKRQEEVISYTNDDNLI